MRYKLAPRTVLVAAVIAPLLLVLANVLLTYAPGLPGHPPRGFGRALFWLPAVVAVALFQLLPFSSWSARAVLTVAFGGVMYAVLLTAYLFGACSFGDCM
jgi:hypothetical protein